MNRYIVAKSSRGRLVVIGLVEAPDIFAASEAVRRVYGENVCPFPWRVATNRQREQAVACSERSSTTGNLFPNQAAR